MLWAPNVDKNLWNFIENVKVKQDVLQGWNDGWMGEKL